GKYSPLEVADWIEAHAKTGIAALADAEAAAQDKAAPDYRRMTIDIAIQCALGRFFAAKLRAGILFALFQQTGDAGALAHAVTLYREARAALADGAARADRVYMRDITFGQEFNLRGHWIDRLPAIDRDIAAIAQLSTRTDKADPRAAKAVQAALGRPVRPRPVASHRPPGMFHAGQPLTLTITVRGAVRNVRLHYRHVDQAERYAIIDMARNGGSFTAAIPAAYTGSNFPLQYYFVIEPASGPAAIYPGFDASLDNSPYYVCRRA
ncbi:MAG TPA: hypothetical protein VNT42_10975, partial [Sphingomonas sp.]|nr:hypothetical protein [Sphingomonas sp.]